MLRESFHHLSQKVLALQKKNRLFVTVPIMLIVGLVVWFSFIPESQQQQKNKLPMLHDVSEDIEDPSAWQWKNEARIQAQGESQEALKAELEKLSQQVVTKNHEKKLEEQLSLQADHIRRLEQRVAALQQPPQSAPTENREKANTSDRAFGDLPVENTKPENTFPPSQYFGGRATGPWFGESTNVDPQNHAHNKTAVVADNGLLDVQFNLAAVPEETKKPNIEAYLPANTFVEAVLLSGVDVSVGISSQAHPKPVVLRVTNFANFPNQMRGALKSCRVSAMAWGELSSERAYMKPDMLSCVKQDGTVLETSVKGFVSGRDGRVGIRGKVITRDGPMVARSFFGGLLSGLGKGAASTFGTTSVSPLGSTTTTQGADIFKSAAAEGTGTAFDRLARYHIKRAEQYQPVIQIGAGQPVDIIFNAGAWLGESLDSKKDYFNPPSDRKETTEAVENILGGKHD